MLTDVLFPAELQLHVDGIAMEKNTVNISVASTNGRSICPHCQTISERVHSSYNRHPADLSLVGYTVGLDMAIHRFFCDNDYCQAKAFTERITWASIWFRITTWIKSQFVWTAPQQAFIMTRKVILCSVTDTAKTTDQTCHNSR